MDKDNDITVIFMQALQKTHWVLGSLLLLSLCIFAASIFLVSFARVIIITTRTQRSLRLQTVDVAKAGLGLESSNNVSLDSVWEYPTLLKVTVAFTVSEYGRFLHVNGPILICSPPCP